MKLYLSSYNLPDLGSFEELIGKKASEARLGLIINAKDDYEEPERSDKIKVFEQQVRDFGFDTELLDLKDYPDSSALEKQMRLYDAVFVIGGYSYSLRRAMLASGFDGVIRKLLAEDFVYGGTSAGATIMGPSLRGFERWNSAPRTEAELDGLGILDEIIVPHCDSVNPAYQNRVPIIEKANPGVKILPLNDDQVYIVNGENRGVFSA